MTDKNNYFFPTMGQTVRAQQIIIDIFAFNT